jgi:hypothetical protein
MQIPKANIIHSEKHRRFVASFPCVVCGNDTEVQCCHIRSIPKLGNVGKNIRDDFFTIPMCIKCHVLQHQIGELAFFYKFNINPIAVSLKLAIISPCNNFDPSDGAGTLITANSIRSPGWGVLPLSLFEIFSDKYT